MSDDLEKRVEQFQCFELPGQPMSMHMGTSYLVNDLWKEIEQLRAELAAVREQEPVGVVTEPNNDEVICPHCCHQFRAIPVSAQRLMLDAGFEPPFTAPPTPPSVPDVDALAQFIREIDGTHSLGAGALAERIVAWLAAAPKPEDAA